jgi:hypothetical protein
MRCSVPQGFGHYADVLQRIAEYRGAGKFVQFRCLFPDRHKHGDKNWSSVAWIGQSGELVAKCYGCGARWDEIVAEVGLPRTAWFADKGKKFESQSGRATTHTRKVTMDKPKAIYTYKDETGAVLFQKLRFEPKKFVQRRPTPASIRKKCEIPEGVESWIWGLNSGAYGRKFNSQYDLYPASDDHQIHIDLPGTDRVLYRLPELVAANPDAPVFFVEGEKDVENLRCLGFIATCTPGGSSSIEFDHLQPIVGRRVVVIPDNDSAGFGMSRTVAGAFLFGGVREIRVVTPNCNGYEVGEYGNGADVSDWMALQEDADAAEKKRRLIEIVKQFAPYKAY